MKGIQLDVPNASIKFFDYLSGLECHSMMGDKFKKIWLTDPVLESINFQSFPQLYILKNSKSIEKLRLMSIHTLF